MSDKKTITINPELFKVQAGGKTRKKNPNPKPIKVKTNPHNKTTRHRLLNHLRQQQEENYKKMVEGVSPTATDALATSTSVGLPQETNLKSSIEYFSNLNEKIKNATASPSKPHNYTLKSWVKPSAMIAGQDILPDNFTTYENVALDSPDVFNIVTPPSEVSNINPITNPITNPKPIVETPKYGCLKGGSLPTYRSWINQTRKNTDELKPSSKPLTMREKTEEFKKIFEKNREMAKIQETMKHAKKYIKKNPKQKRIMRRTFHVGKSKYYPKIGVLVSNKTLRKQITEKAYRLKQTSIEDVKKMLVKKGLIKIGSTCPNDVLRQMYESVNLLCGDLENHNSENLLYNYFNDTNDQRYK